MLLVGLADTTTGSEQHHAYRDSFAPQQRLQKQDEMHNCPSATCESFRPCVPNDSTFRMRWGSPLEKEERGDGASFPDVLMLERASIMNPLLSQDHFDDIQTPVM